MWYIFRGQVIAEADPAKAIQTTRDSKPATKPPLSRAPKKSDEKKESAKPTNTEKEHTEKDRHALQFHFNIQIHISPETSPEQIDTIFSAMARHLKNLT